MKALVLILSLMSFSAHAAESVTIRSEDLMRAVLSLGSKALPEGKIECTSINTGWSPATSLCVIDVDGATAVVDNSEKIVDAVSKVRVPTGPHYHFSGTFKFVSHTVNYQVGPIRGSHTVTMAVITLDEK